MWLTAFREAGFLVIYLVLLRFVTQVQSEWDCESRTYRSVAMFEQCVECPEKCKDQDHRDIATCERACEKKHATPTGNAKSVSSVRPHNITATASQASQPSYSKTRTTDEIPSDGIPTAKIAQRPTNNNILLLAIVVGVLTGVVVMIVVTVVIMLRRRSSRRQRKTTESHVESTQQPERFSTVEIAVESFDIAESNLLSGDDIRYSSEMDLKETCI